MLWDNGGSCQQKHGSTVQLWVCSSQWNIHILHNLVTYPRSLKLNLGCCHSKYNAMEHLSTFSCQHKQRSALELMWLTARVNEAGQNQNIWYPLCVPHTDVPPPTSCLSFDGSALKNASPVFISLFSDNPAHLVAQQIKFLTNLGGYYKQQKVFLVQFKYCGYVLAALSQMGNVNGMYLSLFDRW